MNLKYFIFNLLLFTSICDENCVLYNKWYNCGEDHGAWNDRCFQTPYRGGTNDPVYKNTYQDMHYLVGYAKLYYFSNNEKCKVTFYTRVNTNKIFLDTTHKILYKFGTAEEQESDNYIVTKENDMYPEGFTVSARIIKISDQETVATLELEELYFIWNVPQVDHDNITLNQNGQKGAIVELFGWPYEDIVLESDFLKVNGYLGVKITPPNEYIYTNNWMETNGVNPWEYFYQTVSYKLNSRLGNKKDLMKMIHGCRKKGIRVYSQLVINQMTYSGNDIYSIHYDYKDNNENTKICYANTNWPDKGSTAGSPYFTYLGRKDPNFYTGKPPIFEFPAIPYCGDDFRCKKSTSTNLFEGWVGDSLQELNTGKDYVRQRIADFLTELLSVGITGFSILNAKYISPDDYCEILSKFKNNFEGVGFPDDFLFILEISPENDEQKNNLFCNGDSGINFGVSFKNKLSSRFSSNEILKIKIQIEDYITNRPKCDNNDDNFGVDAERLVLSLENQDNQNDNSNNIKYKIDTIENHQQKYVNMFNYNINSQIRKVFSSYSLKNGGNGFPDGKSDCNIMSGCIQQGNADNCVCTKSVPYVKAFEKYSKGYDTNSKDNNWIEGNYTRIHRSKNIVNAIREWMSLPQLSDDDYNDSFEKLVNPIPSTILTTIPKIKTTIPTTIITTVPKIKTTIPTTILTTVPKIITTIPTTIITTVPKIITTIPSTIITPKIITTINLK